MLLKKSILIVAVLIGFIQPRNAAAQLFSVESVERNNLIPTTAVFVGAEQIDFTFTGSPDITDAGVFEFSGPILRFKLESPRFSFSLGTGGGISGLDDATYFDGAIKANVGIRAVTREKFSIQIPLQLTSSVTSVRKDDFTISQIEFRQVNIVPGAGVRLSARPSDRFRLQLNAISGFGFSTATGGTFGGSAFLAEGQARSYLDRVFGDLGMVFGYDYNFKRFDIEGSLFDYDLSSHSFLVGITF